MTYLLLKLRINNFLGHFRQVKKDGYIDKGDLLLLWNTKAPTISDGSLLEFLGLERWIRWDDQISGYGFFFLIKWLGTYSINWQPWNTQRWLKKPVGKESARTSEEGAHSWWFNQKPKVLILQIDTFTFRRLPSNPHTWNLYINDKQIYIYI